MDATHDVRPLAAFRDNPIEVIEALRATRRPITLTVEGRPAVVLQDAAEYQRLLDLASEADEAEGLRQGLEDVAQGRTRPAREVFAELRQEYGIRD